MSFEAIFRGDWGQVAKITFVDVDSGAAADISGYGSSQAMIFIKPAGGVIEKAATFDTDGTDGVIRYVVEEGLFDAAGSWQVRGQVKSGTAVLSTELHRFVIGL